MGFICYEANRITAPVEGDIINDFKADENCIKLKVYNNIIFAPSGGIIEKIDSANTEIIIKTCDGTKIFMYIEEGTCNASINRLIEEGDYILKGQPLLHINENTENIKIKEVILDLNENIKVNRLIKTKEKGFITLEDFVEYYLC